MILAASLLLVSTAFAQRGSIDAGLPGKPPPLNAPDDSDQPRPRSRQAPDVERGVPPMGERPSSSGTGFVVAEGRVLTNHHVIADCGRLVVRNAGGVRVAGRVFASDRRRDLAIVTVPAEVGPALPFRDAPAVRRGESVVTYGFPLAGLLSSGPTLTTGDISALAGLRDNPNNFQISAPVQPGNSGGPLLDSQANGIRGRRGRQRLDRLYPVLPLALGRTWPFRDQGPSILKHGSPAAFDVEPRA